jgi:starvation-inducible DNA-binding protein
MRDHNHRKRAGAADTSFGNSIIAMDIAAALRNVRADIFILYSKTKSHRRRMRGPDLCECRILLENQVEQLLATTDTITECIRNIGGIDIRPIEQSGPPCSSSSSDGRLLDPEDSLAELRSDNQILTGCLRSAQELCQRCGDIVIASLIEVWIDQARRRAWTLLEVTRSD